MSDTDAAPDATAHADEHEHDHDHGDEHRPPTEEEIAVARARVERLSVALDAISLDELDSYLKRAGRDVRTAVAARLAMRMDPKFIKGSIGRLVKARIRKLPAHGKLEMAADLTGAVDRETQTFLGDSYEEPSVDQLDKLVDHLLGSFPRTLVRAYLAVTAAAQATVAEELDRMLEDDARLALDEEVAADEA